MHPGRDIASKAAARLVRARELLRGQLEALVGLAAIALRVIERAAPQVSVDPQRPLISLTALERAVRDHARVSWALRLIWALRAKLTGDLARVERGEGVDEVLAAEAGPSVAAETDADPEFDFEAELAALRREVSGRESEREERENFGPYLSRRTGEDEFAEILKRPTEEVIALIREALGLAGAQSDPAGFWGEAPRPGLVPRAVAQPPRPAGPPPRSPCPV